MSKFLSLDTINQALEWGYEKAVNGAPGLDSAEELAADYMKDEKSLYDQANTLIRFQNAKSATSGFVTGLGGILTLPISLPANVASVLFVQIRMIAALAHMGGYDIRDDRVKTMVYSCLVANSVKDVAKSIGVAIGNRLALNAVRAIPGKTLTAINQRVGMKLLTKFGEKGVVNLGKAVPLVGGFIGGTFDAYATNRVGNIARDTFIGKSDEVFSANEADEASAVDGEVGGVGSPTP